MNKEQKYEKIAKLTGIIIGLVLVLGISYAVFKTVTLSDKTNEISAGKLDLRIEHEENEISLDNTYPKEEKEGIQQSPYVFDVVNKGTIDAAYDLYIEVDETVSTLPTSVVRYYLTVEEDGEEKIITSSSRILSSEETKEKEGKKLYKIDRKYINTNKTNKYKLYLWIDYDATVEQAANKRFEARVVIEGEQIYDKNRLVKQIDVSEAGDNSVVAYMYADKRVVLKGKGTIASNLSDTLMYEKEEILENYKKKYIEIGCGKEEVKKLSTQEEVETFFESVWMYKDVLKEMGYDTSGITDMDALMQYAVEQGLMDEEGNTTEKGQEFEQKVQEKNENLWNTFYTYIYIDVLKQMGHNTSGITNIDTCMQYMIEQGFMDESGNFTEKGEEFGQKLDEEFNNKYTFGQTAPKKIELEEGITNIPEGLFTGNEEMREVIIPSTVTSIADRAFYGCRGLTTIDLPDSVTNIGSYAFTYCTNLKDVAIPDGVETIGNSAFYGCSGIKKLTIDGTKNYPDLGMNNLEELIIIGKGEMIGYKVTSQCDPVRGCYQVALGRPWGSSGASIKKVIIKKGITTIGNADFYNFNNITNITIPDSVTSVGSYAFYFCTSLTNIKLSNNLIQIGDSAFSGCRGLTKITLPNEVTTIGNNTFESCTNLTNITIPDSVTSIGDSAFSGCRGLTTISLPNAVTTVGNSTFRSCTNLTNITIPESVTSIGNSAFSGCTNLTNITIPESVTSIGNSAFSGCTNLTNITIPDSVTSIGVCAFEDCRGLTNITIPDSVTSIKDGTFRRCSSLTNITIPDSVTNIGEAFTDCKSLTNITIPESVTSIGRFAFQNCTGLTNITIPNSVASIGYFAFRGCTSLKNITIPNSVTSIESSAFSGWTSSQTINIDNTEEYVNSSWNKDWKNECSSTINYLRS